MKSLRISCQLFLYHTSYNILGYLLDKGLATFVFNPLHTNLYRKSLSLRKTKTDKVDAHTIATMLMSDVNLKSYSDTSYHNEELKSLTRYRFDKVKERAKLKSSVSRLVCILFPELEKLVPTLHMASVYALLFLILPVLQICFLRVPRADTERIPPLCFGRLQKHLLAPTCQQNLLNSSTQSN